MVRDLYARSLESPDRRMEALIGRLYSATSGMTPAAGLTETGREMGGGSIETPEGRQTLHRII